MTMIYTKKRLGLELNSRLVAGFSLITISKWALKLYSENELEFEDNVEDTILKLIAMDEGSESIHVREDLQRLADTLFDKKTLP